MRYHFACGDVLPGCPARFEAKHEDHILVAVGNHARDSHGLDEVGADVVAAVRGAIREVA